jgi:cation diffusion facilitator family transporter
MGTASNSEINVNKRARRALQISLGVSVLSLLAKSVGYWITSSNTALSDAAESIIHVLAVAFVYYGLLISRKPADDKHHYGHERIEFISVGVEGTVIVLAGCTIIWQSIKHLIYGYTIANLEWGMGIIFGAGLINLFLGRYVLSVGREQNNMILISNGKHTLTDVYTSAGVVITLVIIKYSEWLILDSIVGIGLAIYVMVEGFRLLRYSVDGLMDARDPEKDALLKEVLDQELPGEMISYHNLRHRTTGKTTWIELHATFDDGISLNKAHEDATLLERRLMDAIKGDVVVTIHLEPEHNHRKTHTILSGANSSKRLDEFI